MTSSDDQAEQAAQTEQEDEAQRAAEAAESAPAAQDDGPEDGDRRDERAAEERSEQGDGTDSSDSSDPSGGIVDKAKALVDRYQRSRLGRTMSRYSTAKGGLLAGGIAYTGLFSVFAALAVGISVLMATIGKNPSAKDSVVQAINAVLPGVIKTGSGSGLVTIDQLTLDSAINAGSIIAFLTLLYTAMGLMGTLKTALRGMFGIVSIPQNPVIQQLLNLVGFLVMMAGVLVTAAASVLTGALAGAVDGLPSWLSGGGTLVLTLLLNFVIDAGVLALLITVCGIKPPRRDLLLGCGLGALAFGILRQVGTGAVGSVSSNPLLASFAAIIVLILWLHLASRVVLMVGAWMANPPRPEPIDHPDEVHAHARPNYVTLTVPETLAWPRQTLTGTVEVDPTAHPDYVPPVEIESDAPVHGALEGKPGLRARRLRRRYERALSRAEDAREAWRGI